MESVRLQFRRAHKLATVFGTTRGEVFNRVLDDIEADIAEADDEDMDEEEKKEIIESVTALRASL
jgi:ribosome maturation protein Sdo1